jgi:uncharacterized protein (TIGR02594 family)
LIRDLFRSLWSWLAPSAPIPAADTPSKPKWLDIARAELGTKEIAGKEANPRILEYWKACDYKSPKGDETAWCSVFVNFIMQQAGQGGTKQPNARSWEKYGKELKTPEYGCIAVLWRGSKDGWQGHVAFYMGPGSKTGTIRLLGGNQGNSVSIADYPASQVLSYRWPVTGSNSRTYRASALGGIGDAISATAFAGAVAQSSSEALAISDGFRELASYWPWLAVVGILLALLTRAIVIYARWHDFQEKGR